MVIATRRYIYIATFFLSQPFIAYIFLSAGRDNEEYARLFEVGDANYLEPFWLCYSWFMSVSGVSDFIQPTQGLFVISVLSAFFLFRLAIKGVVNWVSIFIILLTLLSYQISFVTGALRQGVSFFLFSIFLLCFKERYLFAASVTHVSGVVYLLFSRFVWLVIFVGLLLYFLLGLNDIAFVNGALGRISGYLETDGALSISSVLLFVALKMLLTFLFVMNYRYLLSVFGSRKVLLTIIASPILQALVYIFVPNPVITDRANLIFDPFLLVGVLVLAKRLNYLNTLFLVCLTALKFSSRLYFAIG